MAAGKRFLDVDGGSLVVFYGGGGASCCYITLQLLSLFGQLHTGKSLTAREVSVRKTAVSFVILNEGYYYFLRSTVPVNIRFCEAVSFVNFQPTE